MSSIISIGISFLLFFVVVGFMWLIGVHLLAQIFDVIDERMGIDDTESSWYKTKEGLKSEIQLVMVWAPAILVLFASIRLLAGAGGAGRE